MTSNGDALLPDVPLIDAASATATAEANARAHVNGDRTNGNGGAYGGSGTSSGTSNGTADGEAVAGDAEVDGFGEDAGTTASGKRRPLLLSVRFLIALIGFFGTLSLYSLRANLSIALPCMVYFNKTADDYTYAEPNWSAREELSVTCSLPLPVSNNTGPGELAFEWSPNTLGLVNGLFFAGYLISQLPASFMAAAFGPKRVMLVSILLSATCTLLQPSLAQLMGRRSAHLSFFVLRFLNGLGSGVFYPVFTALLAQWTPPMERTKLVGTSFAGMYIGIVLTFSLGGFMCKSWGWPMLFYVFGSFSLLWLVLWFFVVSDKPDDHPWISRAERDYILESLGRVYVPPEERKRLQIEERRRQLDEQRERESESADAAAERKRVKSLWLRWRPRVLFSLRICTSPCVIAVWVANITFDYGGYTFLTNIPSFMKDVLLFNIQENGVLSAVPFVLYWLVITASGYLVDWLLQLQYLDLAVARKTANTVGMLGPAILVCLLAFTDCNRQTMAVVILSLTVALSGCCFSGFIVNYMDIAPRLSGTLFAVGNSLGAITGFVAPFVIAKVTEHHTHREWTIAFFICAVILAAGGLFFLVFSKAHEQSWARETPYSYSFNSDAARLAPSYSEPSVHFETGAGGLDTDGLESEPEPEPESNPNPPPPSRFYSHFNDERA